jgi:hypothetical protein
MRTDYHDLMRSITGGNDDLVFQFFAVFSRFEYTLKRAGFVSGEKGHYAQANWDKFAAEKLEARMAHATSSEFDEAQSYLLHNPPQKQIVEPDNELGLGWKPNCKNPGEPDAQYLLRLVRNVGNNLFHGGKYPTLPVYESNLRNTRLIEACLGILNECLSLDDSFNLLFHQVLWSGRNEAGAG